MRAVLFFLFLIIFSFDAESQPGQITTTPLPQASSTPSHPQASTPSYPYGPYDRAMYKDGEYIPAPPETPRAPHSEYVDQEGLRRIQQRWEELDRKYNWPPTGWNTPSPIDPEEPIIFELPQDQVLGDCIYAAGASYPHVCFGKDGEVIFEADKDPQSKLDEIKKAQGREGEYNVMLPGYNSEPLQPD